MTVRGPDTLFIFEFPELHSVVYVVVTLPFQTE
jgi:hypothetical protein